MIIKIYKQKFKNYLRLFILIKTLGETTSSKLFAKLDVSSMLPVSIVRNTTNSSKQQHTILNSLHQCRFPIGYQSTNHWSPFRIETKTILSFEIFIFFNFHCVAYYSFTISIDFSPSTYYSRNLRYAHNMFGNHGFVFQLCLQSVRCSLIVVI